VFLGYPFLNVSSVFLFGPFSLLTFTGCVLCVRVSQLFVLECTLGFPVWSLSKPRIHSRTDNPETPTHKTQPVKVSKLKGPNRKTEDVFLCYPFLNVSSVFLFGSFSLLTFTGCVLRVRVSGLSVLECILGFSVWSL
jgi:hypothetical protein